MAERRIRWLRIIIVILALLALMYLMRPETTGMVVQVSINDTVNATGLNTTANETTTDTEPPDSYVNITRPAHYNFSVIFDYKIMFMGYDINETLLRTDDTFEITYYWKALDDMDKDYAAFVHFTSKNGKILFQGDYYPARRTSLWKIGDMYHESRKITVPKNVAAQYVDIRLGWWYPPSGKRLKSEKEADNIIIGRIVVK